MLTTAAGWTCLSRGLQPCPRGCPQVLALGLSPLQGLHRHPCPGVSLRHAQEGTRQPRAVASTSPRPAQLLRPSPQRPAEAPRQVLSRVTQDRPRGPGVPGPGERRGPWGCGREGREAPSGPGHHLGRVLWRQGPGAQDASERGRGCPRRTGGAGPRVRLQRARVGPAPRRACMLQAGARARSEPRTLTTRELGWASAQCPWHQPSQPTREAPPHTQAGRSVRVQVGAVPTAWHSRRGQGQGHGCPPPLASSGCPQSFVRARVAGT